MRGERRRVSGSLKQGCLGEFEKACFGEFETGVWQVSWHSGPVRLLAVLGPFVAGGTQFVSRGAQLFARGA